MNMDEPHRRSRQRIRLVLISMIVVAALAAWPVLSIALQMPTVIELGSDFAIFDVSPEGNELIVAARREDENNNSWTGQFVKTWSLASGRPLQSLNTKDSDVWFTRYCPTGKWLALIDANEIQILDRKSNQTIQRLKQPGGHVVAHQFSPDGRFLVGAGTHFESNNSMVLQDLFIWNIDEQPFPRKLTIGEMSTFAVGPDSSTLICARNGSVVETFDFFGKRLSEFRVNDQSFDIRDIALSRSGEHLAVITECAIVSVWRIPKQEKVLEFQAHHEGSSNAGAHVSFASNDATLISTGESFRRRLEFIQVPPFVRMINRLLPEINAWELPTGRLVRTWKRSEAITDLLPVPSGRRFVTEEDNCRLLIWGIP